MMWGVWRVTAQRRVPSSRMIRKRVRNGVSSSKHSQPCSLKVDDADARWLCRRYLVTGFGAFALWLVDNSLCDRLHTPAGYVNLHSLWHVGMAANCYFGCTFAIYARAQQQGSNPEVIWFKLLPRVSLPMIRKTTTTRNPPPDDAEPAREKEKKQKKSL
jgi:hypothetical protein